MAKKFLYQNQIFIFRGAVKSKDGEECYSFEDEYGKQHIMNASQALELDELERDDRKPLPHERY